MRLSPADLRLQTSSYLATHGFRAAGWLPLSEESFMLRPRDEIVARAMALNVVFLWCAAPEDVAAKAAFWPYIERNALQPFLTTEDRGIIACDRADAQQQFNHLIGWRLENLWALCWIGGFDPEPAITAGMIPEPTIHALLGDFLGYLERDRDELLSRWRSRDEGEVIALEDRFYAAHNAVRSAQLDAAAGTVPDGFDPVADGGCIHERRHALTWSVSPATAWDETDLST